jgi:hypothetical protein
LYLAANINRSTLVSGRLLTETGEISQHYRINPGPWIPAFKPSSGSPTGTYDLTRTGYELGLLETFYYRRGRLSDESLWYGDASTYGYGVSLNGIVGWMINLGVLNPGHNLLGFVLNNLDLSYDYARVTGDRYVETSKRSFVGVSLSF